MTLPRILLEIEKDATPGPNQQVIVCCGDFNCLGFLDEEGTWRDAHNSAALRQVEGWIAA